jgi:hypothetical protein
LGEAAASAWKTYDEDRALENLHAKDRAFEAWRDATWPDDVLPLLDDASAEPACVCDEIDESDRPCLVCECLVSESKSSSESATASDEVRAFAKVAASFSRIALERVEHERDRGSKEVARVLEHEFGELLGKLTIEVLGDDAE